MRLIASTASVRIIYYVELCYEGCVTMPPCLHICCGAKSTPRHTRYVVLCRSDPMLFFRTFLNFASTMRRSGFLSSGVIDSQVKAD